MELGVIRIGLIPAEVIAVAEVQRVRAPEIGIVPVWFRTLHELTPPFLILDLFAGSVLSPRPRSIVIELVLTIPQIDHGLKQRRIVDRFACGIPPSETRTGIVPTHEISQQVVEGFPDRAGFVQAEITRNPWELLSCSGGGENAMEQGNVLTPRVFDLMVYAQCDSPSIIVRIRSVHDFKSASISASGRGCWKK